jgi:hypothetical protein
MTAGSKAVPQVNYALISTAEGHGVKGRRTRLALMSEQELAENLGINK